MSDEEQLEKEIDFLYEELLRTFMKCSPSTQAVMIVCAGAVVAGAKQLETDPEEFRQACLDMAFNYEKLYEDR